MSMTRARGRDAHSAAEAWLDGRPPVRSLYSRRMNEPGSAGRSASPRGDDQGELRALLERGAQGDRDAFRRLYDETSRRLFAIALRMLGDRGLAEDVLQECYMSVWTRAQHFRADRGSAIAWMQAIARNRSIDRLRMLHRRELVPLEELAAPPDGAATAESMTLRRCLEELPEAQRRAILLVYYTGMTHEELSERTDAPLGTVKSRVRRGLRALRNCVEG